MFNAPIELRFERVVSHNLENLHETRTAVCTALEYDEFFANSAAVFVELVGNIISHRISPSVSTSHQQI